ncbi:uncharacterized protein CLUP02_16659 [Colletotrichum lupini]|uniref:Uncharacterized protein n=4 Tax=Colletotrichum acutatum species complex TaxID=2707335 RepID=A0A9Q8T8V5_9PEZI|nr:uncharacterized protein CLUP02_16659 [Colletotrichum lupini]XP_060312346.1 uncharacterized protein CCOS01_09488 [Colletotrichum costaricense]XP_060379846.1 uncharacterized protein CTAM01_09371 [Colletotrichum tamarilloi]KAI3529643.1 hypothetical protein CSPX01_15373 [Colletotrichum filicis]KAK1449050.1 hypothetical protein CMEL01_08365 [Colletotrichum melonis]KAK1493227.1 hypothetical protein CTAM01_09371 [Colletotrichum tamarilloi]KAK1524401.1 hypothetical protein CCOS01_09488 [Colletotri
MRFSALALLPFLATAVIAQQKGDKGECRNDADCIRCVNGVTPLICKTDATSTTGKRCGVTGGPCRPINKRRWQERMI